MNGDCQTNEHEGRNEHVYMYTGTSICVQSRGHMRNLFYATKKLQKSKSFYISR